MPLEAGEDVLIADVQTLRETVLDRLSVQCDMRVSGIPYVIFGHSMGSFVTRVFLTRHAFGVRAAVLCGTGHQARALSSAGRALTRSLAKKHGERYVSSFVDGLGAGAYGKAIKAPRATSTGWRPTPRSSRSISATPCAGNRSRSVPITRSRASCPMRPIPVWRENYRMPCR